MRQGTQAAGRTCSCWRLPSSCGWQVHAPHSGSPQGHLLHLAVTSPAAGRLSFVPVLTVHLPCPVSRESCEERAWLPLTLGSAQRLHWLLEATALRPGWAAGSTVPHYPTGGGQEGRGRSLAAGRATESCLCFCRTREQLGGTPQPPLECVYRLRGEHEGVGLGRPVGGWR